MTKHRLVFGFCSFGLMVALHGETVYDNSIHDLGYRFNPGLHEVGDEIILGGTARQITFFQFEYWGLNRFEPDFQGYVEARVRFYRNDQLDPESLYFGPGTVLYDSGYFRVWATPRATLIFEDFQDDAVVPMAGPVPDRFTWSVHFQGLAPDDSAGVDIYSPPVVGAYYRDYWENVGGDWTLKTNTTVPINFAVLIQAEPAPTPPTLGVVRAPAAAMTVSWPEDGVVYRLQETAALSSAIQWADVPTTPVLTNGHYEVTLPTTADRRFFRLTAP